MSDINKLAENAQSVQSYGQAIADNFAELTRILQDINNLKQYAKNLTINIENYINSYKSLGE